LTKAKLSESSSAAEKYLEQLAITENKLERLKSETIQRMESKIRLVGEDGNPDKPAKANGTHHVKSETPEAPVGSHFNDRILIDTFTCKTINGHASAGDDGGWKLLADERNRTIDKLHGECNRLAQHLSKTQMEVRSPDFWQTSL
jgi:hypothetical protein